MEDGMKKMSEWYFENSLFLTIFFANCLFLPFVLLWFIQMAIGTRKITRH
jgi:hypothetical protein